jgi:dolichol-phosphate mannosyltransferase
VKTKKLFSIVVPVYQNEGNLESTIPKLLSLSEELLDYDIELVFVDDGSNDSSYDILCKYYNLNKDKITVVKLTKNFGQNPALFAGLKAAHGDAIGIISADLQDPYELFVDMLKKWETGKKLVIGERKNRDENLGKSILAKMYWKLVNRYAVKDFPVGGFDFCVIDRQIAEDLKLINEKNSHIFVLIFSLGYPHEIIYYTRKMRNSGKSQYTLSKKIKLFIDTFLAFSYVPIRAISYLGLIISIVSFIYALYASINRIIKGNIYPGWASIVILVSLLGGLILLTLGIIGEYLWRILEETRKRPHYVIDSILNREKR